MPHTFAGFECVGSRVGRATCTPTHSKSRDEWGTRNQSFMVIDRIRLTLTPVLSDNCSNRLSCGPMFGCSLIDSRGRIGRVPHTFAGFECVGSRVGRATCTPTHSKSRNEWGTRLGLITQHIKTRQTAGLHCRKSIALRFCIGHNDAGASRESSKANGCSAEPRPP